MNTALPVRDPLPHPPARTRLVAFLSGRGEASSWKLKRVLGVTDSGPGAHLAKLLAAGYVASGETPGTGRAQTIFALTPAGRSAPDECVTRRTALMAQSSGAQYHGGPTGVMARRLADSR